MFVSNKRTIFPSKISSNNIDIEVVDKLKLLGITIDPKLNFNEFSVDLIKAISKKLFAIKSLFYIIYLFRLSCNFLRHLFCLILTMGYH